MPAVQARADCQIYGPPSAGRAPPAAFEEAVLGDCASSRTPLGSAAASLLPRFCLQAKAGTSPAEYETPAGDDQRARFPDGGSLSQCALAEATAGDQTPEGRLRADMTYGSGVRMTRPKALRLSMYSCAAAASASGNARSIST